ncbi:GntR family transcriptional regulator [Anoxynatronum sibiricum]|uniref:GntR family transcriptional regulator n=1 Tax=Anoxynatronum sibiricum TaxID=210623 RepID=A0ABU9VUB5_9CLOT
MKPSYLRIRDELNRMIEDKQLEVGVRLPSEYEMASRFNVSRETFRAAVKLLEQEGKLLVKHGVGTFIIKPLESIPSSLEKLQSLTSMIRWAGLREGEMKETIRLIKSDTECAKALNLSEGAEVVVIERVRTADSEPVAVTVTIMDAESEAGCLVKKRQHLEGSLFTMLEEELGIFIVRADTEIRVPEGEDPHLSLLQLKNPTPVILLKQIHYDERNVPVFYAYDYLRNDIFSFRVRRERQDM